jgi:hypothetical protein
LPFVGPAIILALLFMHLRPIDLDLKTKLRRLDWGGMFLFTVGATCVSLPVSWADTLYPWYSWRTLLPLVVGVVAFIAFGFYEAYPVEPMLPYRLFKNRTAVVSIIGGTIHGLLLFSLLLYLPLFFQVSLKILSKAWPRSDVPAPSGFLYQLRLTTKPTHDRLSICKRLWNQLSLFFQHA